MLGLLLIVYYFSGLLSIRFDDPQMHISIVWFPAGVATAAFLHARWRLWPALTLIFILLNLLMDMPTLDNLPIKTLYAILALPSSLAIAWIVRRFARPGDDLNIITLWFGATVFISFLDALLFALGFSLSGKNDFSDLFWTGFVSDITGIFLATTVIMGFINSQLRTTIMTSWKNMTLGALIWLALVAITLWVFSGNAKAFSIDNMITHDESLIFAFSGIPIILAAFLTLFWGNQGGSIALLSLSAIVIYYTEKSIGPFFLKGLHSGEPLLLVQSYLTATALLLVFLRVITHNIGRFSPENGLQIRQFAIYELNLSNGKLRWDNLPANLASLHPQILNDKRRLLAQLHPDDQHTLADHWQASPRQQKLSTISFRLQDAMGHWLWVTDSGAVLLEHNGALIILGNWSVSA
nr:MASE1 domain-containing protein [Erwinia sp. OLTSP20]